MRYVVISKTLDKHHPIWPEETFLFIRDLVANRDSYSCYTNYEMAEQICKRKNNE